MVVVVGDTNFELPVVETALINSGLPLAVQEVAPPVTIQVNVEEPPALMELGFAIKFITGAPEQSLTVTP